MVLLEKNSFFYPSKTLSECAFSLNLEVLHRKQKRWHNFLSNFFDQLTANLTSKRQMTQNLTSNLSSIFFFIYWLVFHLFLLAGTIQPPSGPAARLIWAVIIIPSKEITKVQLSRLRQRLHPPLCRCTGAGNGSKLGSFINRHGHRRTQ